MPDAAPPLTDESEELVGFATAHDPICASGEHSVYCWQRQAPIRERLHAIEEAAAARALAAQGAREER